MVGGEQFFGYQWKEDKTLDLGSRDAKPGVSRAWENHGKPSSGLEKTDLEPKRIVVRNLYVSFRGPSGAIKVVRDVGFDCRSDEILAIVGESGSGKTLTALSIIGLLPRNATVSGSIKLDGQELIGLGEKEFSVLRGSKISMIFQNPRASLNPSLTVGAQMIEVIRRHSTGTSRDDARTQSVQVLQKLSLRDPEYQLSRFPHELSGGMCQRIALGIALSGKPRLLLADEPTTALDAIVQANTLRILKEVHRLEKLPIIIVTHDLGVVRAIATRVVVMYAGQVQEIGPVKSILNKPAHPYTQALVETIPDSKHAGRRLPQINGLPPDPAHLPVGCSFVPRCRQAGTKCNELPSLRYTDPNSMARCHYASPQVELTYVP